MALFGFGKKKESEKKASCCCGGKPAAEDAPCCSAQESQSGECCGKSADGICCVKVLGAGCKSCHEMFENAKAAVQKIALPVQAEYVTDIQKIAEYGVMSMPALVVNEKVVSSGKVLKSEEIEGILRGMLQ